jgi:RNA 2',3'-cyclic 3'-phosphodiesterase
VFPKSQFIDLPYGINKIICVMPRLFVALELLPELRQALSRIQDKLKRYDLDVKWVNPDNIHLTIRFLGEINEAQMPGISQLLKDTLAQYPMTEISLEELGAFPVLNNPRVIWIGCKEKGNSLVKAYEALEKGFQAMGLSKDDHAFSPHLTLGRVKSRKNIEQFKSYCEQNKTIQVGIQKVESLTLFQSTLTSTGPIYNVIEEFLLIGG